MSYDETAIAYQEFRENGYRTLESIFALLTADGNFLDKVRAEGIVSPNAKYNPSLEEDRVNDKRIGRTLWINVEPTSTSRDIPTAIYMFKPSSLIENPGHPESVTVVTNEGRLTLNMSNPMKTDFVTLTKVNMYLADLKSGMESFSN